LDAWIWDHSCIILYTAVLPIFFQSLYTASEMGRACSTNGGGMYIGHWWESQKRPLGRPRCRWVDNIKTDLREIWWHGVDWIDMAQDTDQWKALVNTVLNLRVKTPGSSRGAAQLVAPQEGLSSVSK
jgi:hypothetical protein